MRRALASAALTVAILAAPVALSEEMPLEPYKLLRSLQRVQDQIADGDKAALGMQRELVGLIDTGFRNLKPEDFSDRRNAKALIAYAMAGGNPSTLERFLPNIGDSTDPLVQLGVAVLIYQKGAAKAASKRLQAFDPMGQGGLFGAALALVRGLVAPTPEEAIRDLDTARLLAPGTLIEEAALRRLVIVHRHLEDPDAFLRIASRYARRFIESPYALQFAQEFIGGVTEMDPHTNRKEVLAVLAFMPPTYRRAVMTRLIRNATIEGKSDLVAFLADKVPAPAGPPAQAGKEPTSTDGKTETPVAASEPGKFYSLISSVTSENVGEVAGELRKIDPENLSDADRKLLNAVLAIAGAVMEPGPAAKAEVSAQQDSAGSPSPPTIPVDGFGADAKQGQPDAMTGDYSGFVSDARKTLDDIDKVLEDVQ